MTKLVVNKIAVLGAGVMGAQIAAHFANCNYQVYLYDLPTRSSQALLGLTKLKPSPLVTPDTIENVIAVDYDNNLEYIEECNLIIEAVAENIEIKAGLYKKISGHINSEAVLCSNTSGLSINDLANVLKNNGGKDLASRFAGVHFFNPPRYQKLVEIIPHESTKPDLLDQLETFLTSNLGKTVVRAKDTPNFIANRIGVFSMLVAMHYANKYNISFDTVDALTGELIGRPKSATFRTADVVGLDTLASVIKTMTDKCLPDSDPWSHYLITPITLTKLISHNFLGQKIGRGFFYKNPKTSQIEVFNLTSDSYIPVGNNLVDSELIKILKSPNLLERFKKLRQYNHPQAQFLWACYRDVWHYALYHLFQIAKNVHDVDSALKCGFGWKQGPFELMQEIGWREVIDWIDDDIKDGLTLASAALPDWAYDYSGTDKEDRHNLPVYQKQYHYTIKNNILENDSARLWSYNNSLVFSFKTKMNVVNLDLINLLVESVDYLNNAKLNNGRYTSLIIWQDHGDNFCAGADLKGFLGCIETANYELMDSTLNEFQQCCLKLKYSTYPVIAAVKGLAIGAGCELLMHCQHVVAAIESYIGLVETGVGVVPAGGGCKEMLLRANQNYRKNHKNDSNLANIDKLTEQYYKNVLMATLSSSAHEAMNLGYLRETDLIIANSSELLFAADSLSAYLSKINYVARHDNKIVIGGSRFKANIYNVLANYLKGGFISEHDYVIATGLANIFSGGDIDSNQVVSEQWLLNLERYAFIELLKTSKTKDRIMQMLTIGKPLRN